MNFLDNAGLHQLIYIESEIRKPSRLGKVARPECSERVIKSSLLSALQRNVE